MYVLEVYASFLLIRFENDHERRRKSVKIPNLNLFAILDSWEANKMLTLEIENWKSRRCALCSVMCVYVEDDDDDDDERRR